MSKLKLSWLSKLYSMSKIPQIKQYMTQILFRYRKCQELMNQANAAFLKGKYSESNLILRHLVKRTPVNADSYYCIAVAFLSLGNTSRCVEKLEAGLLKFPDHSNLLGFYHQVCAIRVERERYICLMRKLPGKSNFDVSVIDFYQSICGKLDFIVNYKEFEVKYTSDDFEKLKKYTIDYFYENPLEIETSCLMMLYCRYLDVDAKFEQQLFDALQFPSKVIKNPKDLFLIQLIRDLTLPMVPHFEISPNDVVDKLMLSIDNLAKNPMQLNVPIKDLSVHWAMWQYIFSLAEPRLYGSAMSAFERLAFKIWPKLNHKAVHIDVAVDSYLRTKRRVRIGFNVHDSMPMMSGLIKLFDNKVYEIIFLRPGKKGTSLASGQWVKRVERVVEYSDEDTYEAIETIASQELDIIISGPSMATILLPMMSRLALLQIVLLEPNWTDGLTNADYYISWDMAEPKNPSEFYKTNVSFLKHPPYWIERPTLSVDKPISDNVRREIRHRLLKLDDNAHVYLCANTPPKIHPKMDDIILDLLKSDELAVIVLLRSESPIGKVLKRRLYDKLGKFYERIHFLPTLEKNDAHLLLHSVDCCLDSYPLCGMSSSFDGMMLGVPIVTLPEDIPFGKWTAAIYEYIGVTGLTARSKEEYVEIAIRLASDKTWYNQKSAEIKEKSARYVESKESGEEFYNFIHNAWQRKVAGLPPANWLSGSWSEE